MAWETNAIEERRRVMRKCVYSGLFVVCLLAAALGGCSSKEKSAQSEAGGQTLKPDSAHGSMPSSVSPSGTGLKFTAPPGWIFEKPASSMRQAQYRLPRADGDSEDAEMVVYYFQGGGGGVQANIDRWIGQFSQANGSPAGDSAKVTKKEVNGIPVTTVDVSGTYSGGMGPMGQSAESKANYRMLAAVLEAGNGPWFFKLTGPAKTVAKWMPSFESFVDSIQQ
jgi:hypothetical protein